MPNLIFLPGASGSTTFWHPLINRLSHTESEQVIAYPSFGDEPSHQSVYDFTSLSNYVLQQIQSESILIAPVPTFLANIYTVESTLPPEPE